MSASISASNALRVLVVGGHGKVAQHFTRHALAAGHIVFPVIRQPEHASDLPHPPKSNSELLQPIVASIEAATVDSLAELLRKHNPNVVLFAAGAGGKGGQERTKAVDYDGAVKVFDALEKSGLASGNGDFRRLLLVSAVDSRDVETQRPEWYGEEDYARSKKTREAIGYYMQMKYEADRNLSKRTSFPWFVLRPSSLSDDAGKGKVMLGERKTITHNVSLCTPTSSAETQQLQRRLTSDCNTGLTRGRREGPIGYCRGAAGQQARRPHARPDQRRGQGHPEGRRGSCAARTDRLPRLAGL